MNLVLPFRRLFLGQIALGAAALYTPGVFADELSRTPARITSMIPEPGEHTEQVLRELGYVDDDIRRLRDAGVI